MLICFFNGVLEMTGEPSQVFRFLIEKESQGYKLSAFEIYEEEDSRGYDYAYYSQEAAALDIEDLEEMAII